MSEQVDPSVSAYAVSGSVGLPGPLLCQQVLDGVLDPDALVHPLGVFCRAGGQRVSKSARHLKVHTDFAASPQMCVHLNAAQFPVPRRTTLWVRCVNVMEMAFGLLHANALLKTAN